MAGKLDKLLDLGSWRSQVMRFKLLIVPDIPPQYINLVFRVRDVACTPSSDDLTHDLELWRFLVVCFYFAFAVSSPRSWPTLKELSSIRAANCPRANPSSRALAEIQIKPQESNKQTSTASNMVNASFPILHGLVNSTHTSDVHALYPVGNLPTPWPLVVISSLVSLVIACIGFKSAAITWSDAAETAAIRENAAKKSWLVRYREAKAGRGAVMLANYERAGQMDESEQPPEYEFQEHEHEAEEAVPRPPPWRMFNMSTTHMVIVLVSFIYSTARCAIALILSLKVLITKSGSHSASSSLLLLLLSVQTFITNRSIPRLMNIILVLDSLLASTAFIIASFDRRGQYYGELNLAGGNCPAYAPNCVAQAPYWDKVGCGSTVFPSVHTDTDDYGNDCAYHNPNCGDNTYPPFGQLGDALSGYNVLFIMETVIAVFGTIWLITVLVTLYKSHNLFTGSWSDLFKPVGKEGPRTKTGSGRQRMGWKAVLLFSLFGILGAFVVTILTISAHMAQELRSRRLTYLDSFGPSVGSEFTMSGSGVNGGNVSTAVGGTVGNESWTDCFVVQTPSSGNGFWDLWFRQNIENAYRTAAAL